MHQKKISNFLRTFLRRSKHSIPILLSEKPHNDKHLRYVSYSIPLMCSLALLLIGGSLMMVGGFENDKVYADTNDSINLQAASSALTIASPSLTASAEPGGTAYAKSNVTYSVSGAAGEISSWSLRVSYASGKSALAYEGTGSGTTMSGAGGAALTDNKWGYAWTASSTAAAPSAYNTMPAYGSPATMTSGTDVRSSTTGAIHFAAKFASNAVPGHYKTKVLLSLVATPKVTYTLSFNANNGSGAPAAQTCTTTTDSCSITISSTKPTRDGYVFQGWGENSTTSTVSWASSSSITMTASKTIYAVWEEDEPAVTGFDGIKKMQDMTSTICTNASGSGQLYDARDESTYTVQKLSDGKCWMTQNLRIVNKEITSADSNIDTNANYTIPASALWSDTAATTNKVYYNNNTTYGAYYSWYAATAGTNPSSGDASYDICPKNWRLPTRAEYDTLKGKGTAKDGTWSSNSTTSGYWMGGAANASTAAFWYAAGNVDSSSLNGAGTFGRYWSSTTNDGVSAYHFRFGSSGTPYTGTSSKYFGLSVRCVAK